MGALDNIRVIDFGHYVAGPVTGMLLADQGADVIKVDPPTGPALDIPANQTWNRGKRSIALDLKASKDVAVAKDLVASADVVIENFRPGVMDRLGLGPTEMRSHNTSLVYASMPGFGPEDPRASSPAWEGVVLAALDAFRPAVGHQSIRRQLHRRPADREGEPVFTAEPIASMFAALVSSIGIASALHIRDLTGMGQQVQVPLFDAFAQAIGVYAMTPLPFRPVTEPLGNPWDHQYRCADGRWIHLACVRSRQAEQLAEVLDRRDLIERGLTAERLATTGDQFLIHRELSEVFASKPALHWEELIISEELPGAIVRSGAEWLQHPQARLGELFVEIDDPTLGPTRQPAPVVKLEDSPSKISGPAPRHDGDRRSILAELTKPGGPRHSISRLISPGVGPLHGLRVLDLCVEVSGPTCARTLAELGADIIKIDDPKRAPVSSHDDVNRGKRSILLDLDTAEGRRIFWELASTTDVIVENFRSGVVEDLGIDYPSVKRIKPDVIYASIKAYGDEGPWADLPGYETTIEALTGIQARYGGSDRPAVWPYGAIVGYGTGYAAAYGVLLAILERNVTGKGQLVSGSLAKTAGLLQSMFLLDHQDQDWSEPAGSDVRGFGAHQCLYACQDRWIFAGVRTLDQLSSVIGKVEDDADAHRRFVAWCGRRTAERAVAALQQHGIGAQSIEWIHDALTDPIVVRRGLSVIRAHEQTGMFRTTGPGPWLSHSKVDAGRPAPRMGADADVILHEVHRSGELQRLVEEQVVGSPPQGR